MLVQCDGANPKPALQCLAALGCCKWPLFSNSSIHKELVVHDIVNMNSTTHMNISVGKENCGRWAAPVTTPFPPRRVERTCSEAWRTFTTYKRPSIEDFTPENLSYAARNSTNTDNICYHYLSPRQPAHQDCRWCETRCSSKVVKPPVRRNSFRRASSSSTQHRTQASLKTAVAA